MGTEGGARAKISRREFLVGAAALGASLAWRGVHPRRSRVHWSERRDLFPEGVASGDPQPDNVLLWTRYPRNDGSTEARLTVEVSEDAPFEHVVATSHAKVSAASGWTCR